MARKVSCFPGKCTCCECNDIRCLVWHPGHSCNKPTRIDEHLVCSNCSESGELAKVKGCIRCLKCGYKFDCNGW